MVLVAIKVVNSRFAQENGQFESNIPSDVNALRPPPPPSPPSWHVKE